MLHLRPSILPTPPSMDGRLYPEGQRADQALQSFLLWALHRPMALLEDIHVVPIVKWEIDMSCPEM